MKKNISHILFITSASFIFFLDRVTKNIISSTLEPYRTLKVIGNFFRLTRVHNYGISFGILNYANNPVATRIILLIFSILALAFLIWMYIKSSERIIERVAIGLILGGAAGNLIDRFNPGFVIDFLDFGINNLRFFTFNIADSGITIGLFILIILMIIDEKKSKSKKGDLNET